MRACVCRLPPGDHPHIVAVHPEDQVEAAEIGCDELAATLAGNIETMARRDADGALIRLLAGMVAIGSRRIDQHMADAALFQHMPHHAFGKRRTADIAGANEKNAGRGLCGYGYGHGTLTLMLSCFRNCNIGERRWHATG